MLDDGIHNILKRFFKENVKTIKLDITNFPKL